MSNLSLQPYCYINLEVNGDKLLASRTDGTIDVYSLKGVTTLRFFNNRLKSLPVLPNTIQTLICYNNQLETIPSLPENLERLFCANNRLQSLPKLPKSLVVLSCNNNQLQTLPELSRHLLLMSCDKNPLIFVHPCRILERFFLPDHIKNLFTKDHLPIYQRRYQSYFYLITFLVLEINISPPILSNPHFWFPADL
jgi:Leucine-rich repeat (LRR) protein